MKTTKNMKTPKSLLQLADQVGGTVEPLTYRHAGNGSYSRGFAVVDSDNNELLECEPVHISTGRRWLVKNKCDSSHKYVSSLRGLTAEIKPGHTGYRFRRVATVVCVLLALALGACTTSYHCPTYSKSWKELDIDAIAGESVNKTNEALASEISSLYGKVVKSNYRGARR
jgi:hypothetical protein